MVVCNLESLVRHEGAFTSGDPNSGAPGLHRRFNPQKIGSRRSAIDRLAGSVTQRRCTQHCHRQSGDRPALCGAAVARQYGFRDGGLQRSTLAARHDGPRRPTARQRARFGRFLTALVEQRLNTGEWWRLGRFLG